MAMGSRLASTMTGRSRQTLASHFFPKGDAVGRSIIIDIDSVK